MLCRLRELSQQYADGQAVLVLLYLDDVYVAVPPPIANYVLPTAEQAFGPGLPGQQGAGLPLRRDKSEAWTPLGGGRPPSVPANVRWRDTGFVVLGSAVAELPSTRGLLDAGLTVTAGTDGSAPAAHWEAAAGACEVLVKRILRLYERRSQIGLAQGEAVLNSAQCAASLLRYCAEPRMLHLLRSTPPCLLGTVVAPVDAMLQDAWISLARMSEATPTTRHQLSLPVRDGGCGVGGLAMRHEAAYLGSWALCLQPVLSRLPPADAEALRAALIGADATHPVAAQVLAAEDALIGVGIEARRLPPWDLCSRCPYDKVQRSLTRGRANIARASLLHSLPGIEATRLRSCGGPGAGAFLVCSPSEAAGTSLSDGAFAFAIGWRLGAALSEEGATCNIGCLRRLGEPCGAPVDPLGDHLAVCKYGGYKTIRHSQLVHVLRSILRESGATVAGREVEVPAWQRADGTRARLDITFAVEGRRSYVDVTVRHPRAAKYQPHAATSDGSAARVAERGKRLRYPALPSVALEAAMPFSVETFGRLGSSALRLLHDARQRALERATNLRGWAGVSLHSRWLAQLSCSLARSLHEAARAMRGETGPLVAASGEPLVPLLVQQSMR